MVYQMSLKLFFRRFVVTEFVKTCDELVRNWLIKVDTFMIIRGMEHIQAWTMRKEFESNLDVSDSLNDENIDKYKCHKYLKGKKIKNCIYIIGILLPKLFWPTVRKNCSSDLEKLLKFGAEGQEFSKLLRSLEQFIQTVKGQNIFW